MLDLLSIDARIEPGAIIRDRVSIGKNAVIMMGEMCIRDRLSPQPINKEVANVAANTTAHNFLSFELFIEIFPLVFLYLNCISAMW